MRASPLHLLVTMSMVALSLAACGQRIDVAAGRPAPVAAAQRISVDPATGQVRKPDAAVLAQLSAEVSAVSTAPAVAASGTAAQEAREVHLPDGTVGVRVDKRYYHTISVCRLADGSFSTDCPAPKAAAKP